MNTIKITKIDILRFFLISALVVGLSFYIGHKFGEPKDILSASSKYAGEYNPWEGSPDFVLNTNFKNPKSDVLGLEGNAIGWMGWDNYIRFDSDRKIVLKDRNGYVPVNPSVIISDLINRFPTDREILEDQENLVCFFKKKTDTDLNPKHGNWFVRNKKTNTYFFWSIYAH